MATTGSTSPPTYSDGNAGGTAETDADKTVSVIAASDFLTGAHCRSDFSCNSAMHTDPATTSFASGDILPVTDIDSPLNTAPIDHDDKGPARNMSMIHKFRRSRSAVVVVVALAIFTDMFVYGVGVPTLPQIIDKRFQMDSRFLGILLSAHAIGPMLFSPTIGFISDKFHNRKIPLLAGLLALIVSMLLYAYGETFAQLYVARTLQGVSSGIAWTLGFCMLADVFPQDRLGTVMGSVLLANTIGFLVGPPIGGVLFEYLGERAPFLFCVGVVLIDFTSRLCMRPSIVSLNYDPIDDSTIIQPKENVKSLNVIDFLSDPQIPVTLVCVIVSASVTSGIEPTLPLHLAKNFGASPSIVGTIWMFIVVPSMVGCTSAGYMSDKYGRKNVIAFGMTLFAVSATLIGFASNIYWLAASLSLFGLASGISLTPAMPEMADFVHARGGTAFGSAYALYNIAFSGGMFIGPTAGSLLYKSFGFAFQMQIFGAVLIVFAPIALFFYFQKRRHARIGASHSQIASNTTQP